MLMTRKKQIRHPALVWVRRRRLQSGAELLASPTSPQEGDEANPAGKHFQEAQMKATGNSQRRFPRHKSFLDALCDERAGSVDEGKARGFIYLDFSKAFGMASHSILIANC